MLRAESCTQSISIKKLLKDPRVDVNIQNNYGYTGYDLGNEEIKRLIKDSGRMK